MNRMKLKTSAKVNLSLDVVGKLDNGYHLIESVFQTVGIYDIIEIEINDGSDIELSCSNAEIPCDEHNIAYKAVALFREKVGYAFGCKINIEKNIPSQAGMGGGSSDGAAVLYALNKLLKSEYSFMELVDIGKKLGADVPFFLMGGTAYAEGIGEKLTKLKSYSGEIIVIGKGDEGVSTADAYRKIDSLVSPLHPQTSELVSEINNGGANAHLFFRNIFEEATELETVNTIKEIMRLNGADNAAMTGSGSAVFGRFTDIARAIQCSKLLKTNGFYSEVCNTVDKAFIEIK